ncbi:response regulator [uncultured Microbulbifer sp.]|uniref:response regulator n=1 Tax=uncultured Microbulbifer sp. TaxID=348147 RepID=UPI0025E13253|nr:response regulator [uncultured Microbulbifer sp.]
MTYGRSAGGCNANASANSSRFYQAQRALLGRKSPPVAWLAVIAACCPQVAAAFPGESFLLDTRLPVIWVLLTGLAALAGLGGFLASRMRIAAIEESASAKVADLQAENAKLFRQVQSRSHELMARDKALESARTELEQAQEEQRDFLSITGHRMRKPLETLVSTMSLLSRGEDRDTRQLAEAALGQCRQLRSGVEEIQRKGQAASQEPAPENAPEENQRELQILLIENDAHPSLRARLEAHGHRVRRESNGVDGADAALRGQYDVVVVDVQLPLIDGVETARKIRGDYVNESLLIFGLVESPTQADKERFVARGLTGILPTKPSEGQLVQLLNWVDEKTRRRAPSGKPMRASKVLNPVTLERQRDTLGHLAFAELVGDRLSNLPKKITAFTSALTGRHWIDAQHQAQAIAAEAESVGLEMVASRLKAVAARLSIDSERDYCRHQRSEILGLMRSSVQQLKSWREKNVHTEWALR